MHLAADGEDPTNQPLATLAIGGPGDGHEVLDLADAVRRQKARDQHVRVGEAELL